MENRRLLPAVAVAMAALPALAAAGPVNPATTPVQVTLQVPVPQAVTVRVFRASDGLGVATLGPVNAMAGPVTIPWSGGRGPGGTGQPVADGTYRLEGVGADGVTLLTTTPTTQSPKVGTTICLGLLHCLLCCCCSGCLELLCM